MLTQTQKQKIIDKYGKNKNDTGSAKVQVALLTARITDLTAHFKTHSKDHTSRRGLLKLVGDRRRFINYIKRKDIQEYRSLIESLNIRK